MAEDRDLRVLREATVKGDVLWHHHALERLLERGISRAEVLHVIAQGEVIERYPEDRPLPSYLIMHIGEEQLRTLRQSNATSSQCTARSSSISRQTSRREGGIHDGARRHLPSLCRREGTWNDDVYGRPWFWRRRGPRCPCPRVLSVRRGLDRGRRGSKARERRDGRAPQARGRRGDEVGTGCGLIARLRSPGTAYGMTCARPGQVPRHLSKSRAEIDTFARCLDGVCTRLLSRYRAGICSPLDQPSGLRRGFAFRGIALDVVSGRVFLDRCDDLTGYRKGLRP